MLTLVQFTNVDSISQVYTPLVSERPYLTPIPLMNVVTASLVEIAMSSARMGADENARYAGLSLTTFWQLLWMLQHRWIESFY